LAADRVERIGEAEKGVFERAWIRLVVESVNERDKACFGLVTHTIDALVSNLKDWPSSRTVM